MSALLLIVRWFHLAGAMILVGGLFYARVAVGDQFPRFRPWAYAAIGAILVSGIINAVSKPPQPAHYYIWLGIKIILALHVFGVAAFYRGKLRSLTGAVIVTAAILGISEGLRYISLP